MDKNENQVSICKKMEKWLILGLRKGKCKMKLERKKKDSTKFCPTLCDPMVQLLCPWESPSKNTGMGCYFLLQGIFPMQGLNPGLLHCRQTLYPLSHQRSPKQVGGSLQIPACLQSPLPHLWIF